ncbi:hypothetical protein [Hymenobacter antarcticus]|uniref:Uncharacterized protein n=1 Tax=Hymenobacter antarcticus TaxID=486270 RepID=A0ABP7PW81_9BACT
MAFFIKHMNRRALYWVVVITILGLGAWGAWQHRQEQRRAWLTLRLLDTTLQAENEQAKERAANTVRGIRVAVVRNLNQERDQVVLRQAEKIRDQTNELAV